MLALRSVCLLGACVLVKLKRPSGKINTKSGQERTSADNYFEENEAEKKKREEYILSESFRVRRAQIESSVPVLAGAATPVSTFLLLAFPALMPSLDRFPSYSCCLFYRLHAAVDPLKITLEKFP